MTTTTMAATTATTAAITPDAKAAAEQRGRGSAESPTAGAGRDFDGVLTSLGDGDANASNTSAAQASAIGDAASTLAGSRFAGDISLIATLVDRAVAASGTAARSKTGSRDDDGSSGQTSAQGGIPPGLLSLLAGMPTPSASSSPNGAEGLEAADATAPARTLSIPPTPTTGTRASDKRDIAPDIALPDDIATKADGVTASDVEAIAARSVPVPTVSTATPAPATENATVVVGSLGTRGVAPGTGVDKSPRVNAADVVAAHDGDISATTIQTVSFSAQVAPPTSMHAGQLARTVSAAKDAKTAPAGAADRPSATTGKTDAPVQDAVVPMTTTIATIADAVSDLAATPTAAPTPSPTSTPTLAPARTMVLQLAPSDLGTIAVRLHLTGQTLDVQLSVSDPKTLGLVSRERDALAARLDDRGYQLNTLVIQGTDPSASSTAGPHDPSHSGAGTGAQASHGGNQGADGGRRGTSGQTGRETSQGTPGDGERGGDAPVDGRGGLYI